MSRSDLPELVINYSPKLDLRIACTRAEGYRHVGWVEHRFEVKCKLRHPSGNFEYSVADLCFDTNSFVRFEQELRSIQQGERNQAALKNVGEMFVLRLTGNSRKLQAELSINEYLAPSMATLTAAFEVDYDLFVNKLLGEIETFIGDLRLVKPDEVG